MKYLKEVMDDYSEDGFLFLKFLQRKLFTNQIIL